MNRPRLNFLIDGVAFVAFVFLTTTGILTRYVLPPGSGRSTTLWGLDRHGWGDIHFWVALLLLGALALHIVLHWRWVVCMVRGQHSDASGIRVGLGVVGLAGLLGLAAAPLLAPVERTGEPRQSSRLSPPAIPAHQSQQSQETIEAIRGSMTLRQVSDSTGVPLDHLVAQLGLPRDVDPDERIGRLRQHHDISPGDVRRVVKEYTATH